MKKLMILLAVIVSCTIFPAAAFANGHDRGHGHHHYSREAHERAWYAHDYEWREYDRLWREHAYDRHWRRVHAREWHEWYEWHRHDESNFQLRISGDRFELEIND